MRLTRLTSYKDYRDRINHPSVNHYRCVVCLQVTSFDDYNYCGVKTWFYNSEKKLDAFVCDDCKEKRQAWINMAKGPS